MSTIEWVDVSEDDREVVLSLVWSKHCNWA